MSGCNSDPTEGCENSAIVAAINACCSTQSALLTSMNTKLTTINTSINTCCETTNAKFDTMISLLTTIANK